MTTATMDNKGIQMPILLVAGIGFLITAGLVMFNLSSQGHAAFNTSNNGLFWGFPIVVYDFFLLTSTGIAMVACFGFLFTGETFRPLFARSLWLALAGLSGGVAVLMMELGYPLRAMFLIPFSFAFSSPLYWKVLAVIGFTVCLLLLIWRARATQSTLDSLRGLTRLTLLFAILVTALAGVVYGSQSFRPFWASGDIPAAFIVESVVGGLAFVYFFTLLAYGFQANRVPESIRTVFAGRMGGVFAWAIVLHLVFVVGRTVNGLYGNVEGLQAWQYIVSSPLYWIELAALMTALVIMFSHALRRNILIQVAAAVLVMVGLFIGRYEYIIGGQIIPLFKGSWAPPVLSYAPSFTEWLLLVMAIFLANVVNSLGGVLGITRGR